MQSRHFISVVSDLSGKTDLKGKSTFHVIIIQDFFLNVDIVVVGDLVPH